jgi:hypothetical protein
MYICINALCQFTEKLALESHLSQNVTQRPLVWGWVVSWTLTGRKDTRKQAMSIVSYRVAKRYACFPPEVTIVFPTPGKCLLWKQEAGSSTRRSLSVESSVGDWSRGCEFLIRWHFSPFLLWLPIRYFLCINLLLFVIYLANALIRNQRDRSSSRSCGINM